MKNIQDIISNVNKTKEELLKESADKLLQELEDKLIAELLLLDLTSKTQQVQALDYTEITDWYARVCANEQVSAIVFNRLKVAGFGIQKREIILAAVTPTVAAINQIGRHERDLYLKNVASNLELDTTAVTYHLVSVQNRQF